MKSGRMRWVGHLECNGERRDGYRVSGGGGMTKRGYLEDPGVDGRIILRSIFMKLEGGVERIDLAQDRAVMNLRVP